MTELDQPFKHYSVCGSTNDLAAEWARAAAPEWAYVTADEQTAGRGRRGRSWRSTPGDNLLISIVVRPPDDVSEAWTLAYVAALAVVDTLAEIGLNARVKWPNDVLVAGRKLAGILVETCACESGWAAIVGVGVNVNQVDFGDLGAYETRPTSVALQSVPRTMPADIGAALVRNMRACEEARRSHGRSALIERVRGRLAVGAVVRRSGTAAVLCGLDESGSAVVRLDDGTFGVWGTVEG